MLVDQRDSGATPEAIRPNSCWSRFGSNSGSNRTKSMLIYDIQGLVKKGKSSMARSLPVENLLPHNARSIINYLQKSTEVAQWGTPSCSRPQPATDNGVRDGRSNWLVAPPTLMDSTPWAPRIAQCKCGLKISRLLQQPGIEHAPLGMPDKRTACAALGE